MSFKDLLATLGTIAEDNETLAKSVTAAPAPDDKQVAAAAAEAGALTDEQKEAAEAAAAAAAAAEAAGGGAAADKDAPPMAKSMTVKDADGNEVEVLDAEEVLKALNTRLEGQEDFLVKSFGPVLGVIKSQGEMIKSLHAQVVALGGQGRGRRSVFAAIEKPAAGGDLTKSLKDDDTQSMTPGDFMAKSNAAYDAKRITGQELTTIDVCLRQNAPIDPALIRKVALAG